MRYLFLYASILPICVPSGKIIDQTELIRHGFENTKPKKVSEIPLPAGYVRPAYPGNTFANWLRNTRLKSDPTVYLFNGLPKMNQSAQYAVMDIPVGKKDLQQCADAVMRLRAEFLHQTGRAEEIVFYDNASRAYRYLDYQSRGFEQYLETVFSWCGTVSLEKQLHKVKYVIDIEPGYVWIKGGSPGHAVIVMDVAVSHSGKKIFLLAQSYMPAQNIHILKNPMNPSTSPWYEAAEEQELITPEWTFKVGQLRKWEMGNRQ